MQANEKVDIVFAILASGIYRRWYWANYKNHQAQSALRTEWIRVLGRFSPFDIRDGLRRWAVQFGVDTPPTPDAFADFIRPVHTPVSRAGFDSIRQMLE